MLGSGKAPRGAITLSVLALVATYLCVTQSDGESALEMVYTAPPQMQPQVMYQSAMPQAQAYASQPMQGPQYMMPQAVAPMATAPQQAFVTAQPQNYAPIQQPVLQQQVVAQQAPPVPQAAAVEMVEIQQPPKAATLVAAKEDPAPAPAPAPAAEDHAAAPAEGADDESQDSAAGNSDVTQEEAGAVVAAGAPGEAEAQSHIAAEMAKVRKLQEQVLDPTHLSTDKKLVTQAPEDAADAEGIVKKWASDRVTRTYKLADKIDAQRTINEMRPLVHTEEAMRAKEIDRQRTRAEAFARTEEWWRDLAEKEKSPNARFRMLVKTLGSLQDGSEAKDEAYRRVLRMWHALRKKSQHLQWRLDHARSALAKASGVPMQMTDSTASECDDKWSKKLDEVKANAKAALDEKDNQMVKMQADLDKQKAKIENKADKAKLEAEEAGDQAKADVDAAKTEAAAAKQTADATEAAAAATPVAPAPAAVAPVVATPAAPVVVDSAAAAPAAAAPPGEFVQVQDPVSDAQAQVTQASVDALRANAEEQKLAAESAALHEKEMLAAKALDMTEAGDDPSPADIANQKQEETNQEVAKQAAKAKAAEAKRDEEVSKAQAEGDAEAKKIKAEAEAEADKAQAEAQQLEVENTEKKDKAKVEAKEAQQSADLEAEILKKKAKIKASEQKEEFKMEATKAKEEAKVEAVKAKAKAATDLKIAEAKATAKAADEKKAKADEQDKGDQLRLAQASADEKARKEARKAKEKADKDAEKVKLEEKLKKRSVKESAKKAEMKDHSPGAEKVKRLARRASRDAREMSRKAARATRRKNRRAARKLEEMQEAAQDAVKAQARQAIKVLRKKAEDSGLQSKDADMLSPELVKVGQPPAMSSKQREAMKAAYAVGAARRAAKLAWMKVIQKMDKPTAGRERLQAPGAPSVAASTAMKALVSALKPEETVPADAEDETLMQSQYKAYNSAPKADGAEDYPEASMRLPKDHQWDSWENYPAGSTGPRPKEGEARAEVQNAAPPMADDMAVEGEMGQDYGMELEQMNNAQANKAAKKVVQALQTRVERTKASGAQMLTEAGRKLDRLEHRMETAADLKAKRTEQVEDQAVAVIQEDLDHFSKRAAVAKSEAQSLKQKELTEGKQVVDSTKKFLQDQAKASAQAVEAQLDEAKKDMANVLENGGKTYNPVYAAQLFTPGTDVISDSQFQELQDKKKEAEKKQAEAEADAQTELLEQEKQREEKRQAATEQLQDGVKGKAQRITDAQQQLNDAKKALKEAEQSAPTDEAILEVDAPVATADDEPADN